jgi:pimeloyl-ACP methyl ester carboxylesterase
METCPASKGELVQFKTKDGLLLEGFLTIPKKSNICVIYVHEWGGNFYREPAAGINRELGMSGIAVFSINTRGHDKIAYCTKMIHGKRTRFDGGVEFEKFEDSKLDIDGAINRMEQLGFKKFVLCGHSTGCQKVAYYQFKRNNKKVIGIVLLSPGDDYNEWKDSIEKSGRNFDETVKMAKISVAKGDGRKLNMPFLPWDDTPERFLSVGDLKNVEARLFNYDGELKEFASIKLPVLLLFGSKEGLQHARRVEQCITVLREKSNSKLFESHVVKGAVHWYWGYEDKVADCISNFVSRIGG